MKVLSLILSVAVFFVSGYFLVTDFKMTTDLNYLIYLALLVTLMLVCVVGVMINLPLILRQRRRMRTLIYNSYSSRRVPNKEFDKQFSIH